MSIADQGQKFRLCSFEAQAKLGFITSFDFLFVNFERTFWYPRIKEFGIVLLGEKNEFVCSFFGRIIGLKNM